MNKEIIVILKRKNKTLYTLHHKQQFMRMRYIVFVWTE